MGADGESVTVTTIGGYGTALLSGRERSSAYVLGGANFLSADGETDYTVGAGLGYRVVGSGSFVFRLEGRFQHYFDANETAISLLVGIGRCGDRLTVTARHQPHIGCPLASGSVEGGGSVAGRRK